MKTFFMRWKLMYQYVKQKNTFANLITLQKYNTGQIGYEDAWSTVLKNVYTRKMIYYYRIKGTEMEPTVSPQDTLVVRKLPYLNASLKSRLKRHQNQINVGDVVVVKDPTDSENHVIRRLVAGEGYEMVSTNEDDDEPFIIDRGQGWVICDNKNLKPEESKDSRTYGPISMSDILGRVVYRYRTVHDHGLIENNKLSMNDDLPVLQIELDNEEIQRFADGEEQIKSS